MGVLKVFKNQSFKNPLFSSSQKKVPLVKSMVLLFFINKIKNLRQFSEKKSQLMGFKSCCQIYNYHFWH